MCGIFGYISRSGKGPDIDRLRRLALVTQTRGPHAFGLAWLTADGTIGTFKWPGPASEHLAELERCRGAVAMVGHCRWATHGDPADNRNNHPHPAGTGWLVHNGVVVNYRQLLRRHHLYARSQCDSEVLGLLIARRPGSIVQRSAWAVAQAEGTMALMGLWSRPARLLVARRGRPLHFGQAKEGCYLASLAPGLPGEARAVPDDSARVLLYADAALCLEGDRIDLPASPAEP